VEVAVAVKPNETEKVAKPTVQKGAQKVAMKPAEVAVKPTEVAVKPAAVPTATNKNTQRMRPRGNPM
jgi:hypothetical protein